MLGDSATEVVDMAANAKGLSLKRGLFSSTMPASSRAIMTLQSDLLTDFEAIRNDQLLAVLESTSS